MSSKRLTVITPVYNQSVLVRVGLDSVPPDARIEHILVDDGSTDKTWQALTDYKNAHPEKDIKVFHWDGNLGVSYAVNKGLDEAKGEYVVLLGSDGDYFYPGSLLKAMDEWFDGTDLVYFDASDNRRVRRLTPKTKEEHTGSFKFMRRAFIGDTRCPLDRRRSEDDVFLRDLLAKNPTEKFTNEIVKHYNYPRRRSLSWNAKHGLTDQFGYRPLDKKT